MSSPTEPPDEWFDWYMPEEEPPTEDDPDEERIEVEQRYIDQIGLAFQAEMKLPTPKPVSRGLAQQVDYYGTAIHQQIEKHYADMVYRNPDGSDPLVQEPKGKP
jgi:hypothetical protein